jgi:hypothetical protein
MRAQTDVPALSSGRVTAQVGVGLLAMPIGFFGSGLVASRLSQRFGASEGNVTRIATFTAWTGGALATAAGPAMVGARGPGSGSYPAAVGGAVAGGLLSYAIVKLNDPRGSGRTGPCKFLCVLSGILVFTAPSVGATVGYNLSR